MVGGNWKTWGERRVEKKLSLPPTIPEFLGFDGLLKGFSRLNPILTLNFPKVKEGTFLLLSRNNFSQLWSCTNVCQRTPLEVLARMANRRYERWPNPCKNNQSSKRDSAKRKSAGEPAWNGL